jgi:hypothetical protein
MSHDPCNPLPSSVIPTGLALRPHQSAMPQHGPSKPGLRDGHAITALAPTYLGCDHTRANHVPIKSVQMPPAFDLPATLVPRATTIAVGTLPKLFPEIRSVATIPPDEVQLPMPEPSSIIMFLFAIILVWCARRLDTSSWNRPPLFAVEIAPAVRRRRRHRSKSVACYQAFQH